ncbi:MAG: PEGA domain-containing protein [Myxococcaceae bacterium]|nr:PEGA domain-containing protein [Myxococcaceae bacterium]
MLGLVLAAALCAAEKEKIAIVDLDAPPGMLGLSTQVIKSIVTEAQKQKRTVVTPDELRDKLGNKTLNELAKCADKPGCASEKLSPLGATKVITGKLNRDEKNYVLQLWLLDLGTLSVVSEVDRSILIASRRFQNDVDAAVPAFLRGEREVMGTLIITATTQDAQVSINNEFMGVAPLTQTLKPGKYEVRVEKTKYLPVKRFVSVEPNQKTTEEFRMLLKPGEIEDQVAPLAAKPREGDEDDDKPGITITAPTIVAGVATVASFGAALAFGFLSKGAADNLLKGYDEATDTYAGTRQQALDAQRNALIANVFYGVSGAALIATVVLFVLDVRRPADGDTDVEVTPAPAPGGGGLMIRGHF